jgi:hypothetical protein
MAVAGGRLCKHPLLGGGATDASPRQLNNGGIPESCVFCAIRRCADSDATMEHFTLRHTHQQSKYTKKYFLWGSPRGYIKRADWSFEWGVRRLGVGLQEGSLRKVVLGPGEKAMGRAVVS